MLGRALAVTTIGLALVLDVTLTLGHRAAHSAARAAPSGPPIVTGGAAAPVAAGRCVRRTALRRGQPVPKTAGRTRIPDWAQDDGTPDPTIAARRAARRAQRAAALASTAPAPSPAAVPTTAPPAVTRSAAASQSVPTAMAPPPAESSCLPARHQPYVGNYRSHRPH